MRFFTESRLGPKRSLTPEGFLVCHDVPIARTGEMLYVAGETPVDPGRDGIVHIRRGPADLFHPDAIASFLGKPVTLDHPPVMVGPANFKLYAVGSAQNVRQGEGEQADLMLADLVIADAAAIKAVVEDGIDEVSNGYDAEYEQDAPGLGRQINIRGNHVAIVREGRCGPRCAIGDAAPAVDSFGAGIALHRPDGRLLFLKRGADAPHPGTWCFPGGKIEPGEDVGTAARRETREETGLEAGDLKPLDARNGFVTYAARADAAAEPRLNDEHTAFRWAAPDDAPQPLHPGVAATLAERRDALADIVRTMDAQPISPNLKRIFLMPRKNAFDRLRRALFAKDEAAIEQAMNEVQDEVEGAQEASQQSEAEQKLAEMVQAAVQSALEPLMAAVGERLDGMDSRMKTHDDDLTERKRVADEAAEAERVATEQAAKDAEAAAVAAKAEEDKGDGMTADAAGLAAEFQDTKARAEILSPGIKLPVYDGKATKKTVADGLCQLRREALRSVLADGARKGLVSSFVGDAAAIPGLSCEAVKMAFVGASELAKAANRAPAHDGSGLSPAAQVRASITDLNARNKAFWNRAA